MDYTQIDALVAQSQKGDRRAAGALLTRFLPKIYKLAAAIDNREDHRDCVQDLCLAFLQGLKAFDSQKGTPFNAFISRYLTLTSLKWQIGRHKCFNGGRYRPRQVSLNAMTEGEEGMTRADTLADTAVDVEKEGLLAVERATLRRLVFGPDSPLSKTEQQLVQAHYYRDQSIRGIAAAQAKSKSSVDRALKQALKKLRCCYRV